MTRLNYADPKPVDGYPENANIVWHFDEYSVTFFPMNSQEIIDALAEGIVIEDYIPPEPVVPPPYVFGADVPWNRMTEEEAELVQGGIDASPAKTRNIINKATSFTQGSDAFTKFTAIIVAALGQVRADEIMGPPTPAELSAVVEVI